MPETLRDTGATRIFAELAWARGVLERAGVEGAERVATTMWAAVTGREPGAVWLERHAIAGDEIARRFRGAVKRHAAGTPVAYAHGVAAFRTLDLAVDARVLIPRPETEGLVEQVLRWSEARWPLGRWGVVADIGTGSGAIALSLAVEGRFARVIATDVASDALQVARANADRIAPPVPIEFRCGDLCEPLADDRPDIIVANPPYIAESEFPDLDPAVRDFEPRVALVGGVDGLGPTRSLLGTAACYLSSGGLLAVEIDCRRVARYLALAGEGPWGHIRMVSDVFGLPRYLLATLGST